MAEGRQTVVIVRHGRTEWSAAGRHTGRTDLSLIDEGRRGAADLGGWLAARSFDTVWTSPLRRAADTCALAGYGDHAEVIEDLVEWDYGELEGRTNAEIVAEQPGWQVWTHGAPGGETVAAVQRRVDRLVGRLLSLDDRVLIFGHGHLLRALAARWIELPVTEGRRLLLDTAASGELGWYHGRRALAHWNLGPPVIP